MSAGSCAFCAMNRIASPVARQRAAAFQVIRASGNETKLSCGVHLAATVRWLVAVGGSVIVERVS